MTSQVQTNTFVDYTLLYNVKLIWKYLWKNWITISRHSRKLLHWIKIYPVLLLKNKFIKLIFVFYTVYNIFCRHDKTIGVKNTVSDGGPSFPETSNTTQFGVTLQFIKQNYNTHIPPVVRQCVEYLDKPDGKVLTLLNSSLT